MVATKISPREHKYFTLNRETAVFRIRIGLNADLDPDTAPSEALPSDLNKFLASTRDFYPALAALVSPVQNIFSLVHYFNLCVPVALGSQSCRAVCL